jgi:centromere protein C
MAEFSDEESHLPEQPDEIEGLTHMEIADDQDQGSDEAEAADDEEGGYEDPDSPLAVASASGRGRKRKNTSPPVPDVETSTNPGPKKRGRKPKAAAQQADVEQAQASRPSKKAKTSQSKSREGNVDLSVEQESQLNRIVDNYAKRNGPLDKNRSLCILRRESPSGDTVKHTRSGRVSVRPLAYWRNEKIVFGGDDVETGQRYPVSTIKEVIRTEEEEASWVKKKGKRGAKKKSKSRKNRDSPSDDEDDEHAEPWETDGGVFYGAVKAWDPELQAPVEEEELTGMMTLVILRINPILTANVCRSKLRASRNPNARSEEFVIPFRQSAQQVIPRRGCCRNASRLGQKAKEFKENAHGVLRLSWQDSC